MLLSRRALLKIIKKSDAHRQLLILQENLRGAFSGSDGDNNNSQLLLY